MSERFPVVLCWHMHQPDYRDGDSGAFRLPWTYLHATKDYVDMAAHLESQPAARAVVNFAPVLLEQIEDYAQRLRRHLEAGTPIGDPLLDALAAPELPADGALRAALLVQCLRANEQRVIGRFAAWAALAAAAKALLALPAPGAYIADALLGDMLVWYHLGWLGESVRRQDPRVRALEERAHGFDAADRRALLVLLAELLAGVLPRYRRLADAGQVELAMSPHAHPILPLLLDFGVARQSQPGAPLPEAAGYPGGAVRARWHLDHGRAVFRRHFGREPTGCWPSEGALSDATLGLLADAGFRWTASGERVLHNSRGANAATGCLHHVYRVDSADIDILFRDDGLSDLIGFSYASWHAEDAVANLVHHLENIAAACPDRGDCAVLIALDGENAWEYYPENAWHFLQALYRVLATHPRLELQTIDALQARPGARRAALPGLVAGSWVYGTLSTWIGSSDKNRGWDMLVDAKRAFDRVLAAGMLDDATSERATRQLAVCEGSDWFWWFGDYNPAESVSDFESLFRTQLGALYRLLGVAPPAYLGQVFTHGGGVQELGGVMRHAGAAP